MQHKSLLDESATTGPTNRTYAEIVTAIGKGYERTDGLYVCDISHCQKKGLRTDRRTVDMRHKSLLDESVTNAPPGRLTKEKRCFLSTDKPSEKAKKECRRQKKLEDKRRRGPVMVSESLAPLCMYFGDLMRGKVDPDLRGPQRPSIRPTQPYHTNFRLHEAL